MKLLERATLLDQLQDLLHQAGAGHGRLAFVAGEAGIGKSSLVATFAEQSRTNATVLRGACDPLSTPRPLGPLIDILSQAGAEASSLVQLADQRHPLFERVFAFLSMRESPALVIIEDAHWADGATLDLLRYLGRRIDTARALVLVTYRDDETGATHPLRVVLGDLATTPGIRRVQVPALSVAAIAELASGTPLDPVALHRQTSGNPFFATEVLAASGVGIPPTVRDAVLARAARLTSSARALLDMAATIGPEPEVWLLERLAAAEAGALDECVGAGILLSRPGGFAFRHELVRETILTEIPPHRRVAHHRAVLSALTSRSYVPQDPARLAYHAEEAGEAGAVIEYAPQAAQRAAALGSHREAAAQYARTLRFAHGCTLQQRAELLEAYAHECRFTDQLGEAHRAYADALALRRELGDRQGEGEVLCGIAGTAVLAGRNADAEAASRESIEILESLPPSRALAVAYRQQANLRMLNRDSDEAVAWGERAIELAERFSDNETVTSAYNTIGAARLVAGDLGGVEPLERSLTLARQANNSAMVANAYSNLGSALGEIYQFERADQYLTDGIDYTAQHDIDFAHFYMLAWLALSHLYQGRWRDATDVALAVLDRPNVAPISRIMAAVALGRVRARRGDPDAWPVLDAALELAEPTGTLQRIAPVRAARAEAAWLVGDLRRCREEARAAWDLAVRHRHAWHTGELAYWRSRTGDPDLDLMNLPDWCAEPFALQLREDWHAAAQHWQECGCPYEAARAMSDGQDDNGLREALATFERLGAMPMAAVVLRRLRERGVRRIPRGPRPSTRANPAGLTAREAEVLALLAEGLQNNQIAARLFLAPKTVEHHVSAILGKLGVTTRAGAVLEASKLGLLQQTQGTPHTN